LRPKLAYVIAFCAIDLPISGRFSFSYLIQLHHFVFANTSKSTSLGHCNGVEAWCRKKPFLFVFSLKYPVQGIFQGALLPNFV
jgi:hypothetical protein